MMENIDMKGLQPRIFGADRIIDYSSDAAP